jgi:hypothetical protein
VSKIVSSIVTLTVPVFPLYGIIQIIHDLVDLIMTDPNSNSTFIRLFVQNEQMNETCTANWILMGSCRIIAGTVCWLLVVMY